MGRLWRNNDTTYEVCRTMRWALNSVRIRRIVKKSSKQCRGWRASNHTHRPTSTHSARERHHHTHENVSMKHETDGYKRKETKRNETKRNGSSQQNHGS